MISGVVFCFAVILDKSENNTINDASFCKINNDIISMQSKNIDILLKLKNIKYLYVFRIGTKCIILNVNLFKNFLL